ncbi:MAG: hypothetical protein AABX13_02950, partial [Nanoarchaeota archaeon]
MSFNPLLRHLVLSLSFAACSSPFEAEQYRYNGDGGTVPGPGSEPGNNAADQAGDKDCYTSGCTRTSCTFYDDYAGKELDACRWNVRAGSPYLRDGY